MIKDVCKQLDKTEMLIQYYLGREACSKYDGTIIKDLSYLNTFFQKSTRLFSKKKEIYLVSLIQL